MQCYELSMQILRCEYYRNDYSWNYPGVIYPFDTFYYVLGGDGFVRTARETVELRPERIYLIPANVRHDCWCENAIEKVYVEAFLELLPGLSVFARREDIPSVPVERDAILALARDYDNDLAGQLLLRGEVLRAAGLLLGEGWEPPGERMLRFKPLLDDIGQSLAQRRSTAEIAARHGWNPSALSHAFQREFRMSLKRYMDGLLMTRLRQELILSRKTLRELAAEYNFSDAYYLSAFFKRHEGVSPLHYRRSGAVRKPVPAKPIQN